MINAAQLLADLQKQLKKLEDDLRRRCSEYPTVNERVQVEFAKAQNAGRTGQTFEVWRDEFITQVAVAWLLACVFVRFIEDNKLLDQPQKEQVFISGAGKRLTLARDNYTLYVREYPAHSDREYLEHAFRTVAKNHGVKDLFDAVHNPLWILGISGDAAGDLLKFWQQIDAASGQLKYDFADEKWDTRFLGDLYQDLSVAAQKKYALKQTPIFVEEFILDRTLTPAINEFGFRNVRLIDPTCGSGHFLLGAFARLFDLWQRNEPAVNSRELARRALSQVYGVDLNPFAVAIARFRLLVAALKASEMERLQDTPAFEINLAVGDSLLHGGHPPLRKQDTLGDFAPSAHHYETEDKEALERILKVNHYHAVVGNPPYITVKDTGLNQAYRKLYGSCHMKYSLAVPFMERFFDLAINGKKEDENGKQITDNGQVGFVGQITANSFMKREFGKKLIEEYIPRWDITHVIDTSGAYIPGHGTPTVILFGCNRKPIAETIRTVMGIKGEPSTPADPAQGKVWTSITTNVDLPEGKDGRNATVRERVQTNQNEFVSVSDSPRINFHRHPWSIGGGGAAELKELLDEVAELKLEKVVKAIGFMAIQGEDEAFVFPHDFLKRHNLPFKKFVAGEMVRDWQLNSDVGVLFVYDERNSVLDLLNNNNLNKHLWLNRTGLRNRTMFGKKTEEHGLKWFEYLHFLRRRFTVERVITFANVATHNQFVILKGGVITNSHAPVLEFDNLSNDLCFGLTALVNSSTACFWMKQVFFPKGGDHVGNKGARVRRTWWDERYEWDSTKLKQFPIPKNNPLELARALDLLAQELQTKLPSSLAQASTPNADEWLRAKQEAQTIRERMIALQEELDWECYQCYGLTTEKLYFELSQIKPSLCAASARSAPLRLKRGIFTAEAQRTRELAQRFFSIAKLWEKGKTTKQVPPIKLGMRAFEIVMARKMARGELQTTWFERHNSTPITELPAHWSDDYQQLVEKRIALIETDGNIRLIEQPEYKRRWNTEAWDSQAVRALREWLLNRLEDSRYWSTIELTTTARLADRVRSDAEFMEVAEMYRGRKDFDLANTVAELVKPESVPLLPLLRYKESGLRKRELWERTWDLQRLEDKVRARIENEYKERLKKEGDKEPDLKNFEQQIRALVAQEVGEIAVPPKYKTNDFQDQNYWRLRGKLDVPKERFISFPYCQRDADQSLVIAWAGWNHLQQAEAIANYYTTMKTQEGWGITRLVPLLACLLELTPWLLQWHNELDPAMNLRLGDFYKDFAETEARSFGLTLDRVKNWKP